MNLWRSRWSSKTASNTYGTQISSVINERRRYCIPPRRPLAVAARRHNLVDRTVFWAHGYTMPRGADQSNKFACRQRG
eukprot:scaffold7938_cov1035-Prasinococcus_capsulatus_cf.AAC.1